MLAGIDLDQIVFLALAGLSALAAVGVVALNSPVRSALALVVNFFILAFVYFSLNAQLLGITQILVYTGAIMVLFLFVIMLLNLGSAKAKKGKFDIKPVAAIGLGLGIFGMLASTLVLPFLQNTTRNASADFGGPKPIGQVLFTDYVYPFEVASILLLVGIVGSILLAKRRMS